MESANTKPCLFFMYRSLFAMNCSIPRYLKGQGALLRILFSLLFVRIFYHNIMLSNGSPLDGLDGESWLRDTSWARNDVVILTRDARSSSAMPLTLLPGPQSQRRPRLPTRGCAALSRLLTRSGVSL